MINYCLPLRQVSQTCSLYNNGETKSIFSCPCEKVFKCVLDSSFQIHSLINIHKDSICKNA